MLIVEDLANQFHLETTLRQKHADDNLAYWCLVELIQQVLNLFETFKFTDMTLSQVLDSQLQLLIFLLQSDADLAVKPIHLIISQVVE